MAGYGYQSPSYGYRLLNPTRPKTPSLASAAAFGGSGPSPSDPFGLLGNRAVKTPVIPELPYDQQPRRTDTGSSQSGAPPVKIVVPQATTTGAAGAPVASTAGATFDLNTDPAYQQVQALTGLNDEQAKAAALKQRQQQLLAYGDPTLAAAVLGANDPIVQAAKQNQESTLAMLGRQKDQQLSDFERALDPSLTFSGYKVRQEHQLGQSYQDALAQAAAQVQQALDGITGNLDSALFQNEMAREQALAAARDRASTNPPPPPPATTTTDNGSSQSNAVYGAQARTAPNLLTALAMAAANRQQKQYAL